jgi:hypothetical protein
MECFVMTADGDRFARINRGLEGKLACPQIGRGFEESKRKSAEFQFNYSFGCMTIMSFISSEIPFAPVRLGEIGRGSGCYGGTKVRSVVPSGHWFGARPAEDSSYSFAGCTVAPGLILRWWTRRICAAVFLHQKREYAGFSRRLSIEQAPWEYPLQASDLFRRLAC